MYVQEAVEKPLQQDLKVILNDGEQLCPQCNGAKVVRAYNSFERRSINVLCGACLGKGKLDWLEMVTGPKDDHLYINGGSSSCSSSGTSGSSSSSSGRANSSGYASSSGFNSTCGVLVAVPLDRMV
jgi:hypothetical protein